MPKSKRTRLQGPEPGTHFKNPRKMRAFSKLSTKAHHNKKNDDHNTRQNTSLSGNPHLSQNSRTPGMNSKKNPSQQRPIVPFGKKDRILLIGEGDFSFARSLVEQHRCRHVLATSYDSKETLYNKYPQVDENIQSILGASVGKQRGVNEEQQACISALRDKDQQPEQEGSSTDRNQPINRYKSRVIFSVDARKLGSSSGGYKDVRMGFPRRQRRLPAWEEAKRRKDTGDTTATSISPQGGPWDIICFNFPHVGGLSTDVNRQVRANQELLVSFFKACMPLLSPLPELSENEEDEWDSSTSTESDRDEEAEPELMESESRLSQGRHNHRTEPGQILVSIFEGEPYTLWNIRDLARHAGLRVVTSFRFPWASYRGYSHARTLGEVEGKQGRRGGWRGEDREARMYVFEVRRDDRSGPSKKSLPPRRNTAVKSKRARDTSDSDDD